MGMVVLSISWPAHRFIIYDEFLGDDDEDDDANDIGMLHSKSPHKRSRANDRKQKMLINSFSKP